MRSNLCKHSEEWRIEVADDGRLLVLDEVQPPTVKFRLVRLEQPANARDQETRPIMSNQRASLEHKRAVLTVWVIGLITAAAGVCEALDGLPLLQWWWTSTF